MAHDRAFDIVVFGATGFTGGLVAEYLAGREEPLRWAIAGRDRDKLARVRERLPARGEKPEIVIAEVGDPRSLEAMAQKARVVLTTVGPYTRHGEPLVAACVAAGAHYVDLTGEPVFLDRMRARYDAEARDKRVKIVNACGFDSIPHDLGAYFTVKALRARMTEAEREKTPITVEGVVRAGGSFSGGTWHSVLEAMQTVPESQEHREPATNGRKVGSTPRRIRFRKELGVWTVPMPTIDPVIVLRSARLLDDYGPDFRYGHFFGLRHWYQIAALGAGFSAVGVLAQLPPTRKLLEKVRAPGEGPDEATRAKGWFTVTFEGRAGAHALRCQVRGGDPGYGETAKMISHAALSLAHDDARLPAHYGVVPTAAAIGDALIERLVGAGIAFEEMTSDAALYAG